MEGKVLLLHVSLNPNYYDLESLSQYTFDEAKKFCEEDEIGAKTWELEEVETTRPNEFSFHADGVSCGDGSDTMLNWIKVI